MESYSLSVSLSLSRCLSTWYRVMNNYLSHHVASPSDLSCRFYSRSSLLSSLARSWLLRCTSVVDVAGVEGYHRVLYHISYYNVLKFLPARFLSVLRFFFLSTDTCVCVRFPFFYHARSRDNPCPDVSVLHIFFSSSCADSLKNPCTDPIGDSRSLVRTLPRDRVLFFLSACEGLCRRIREIYLSDISQLQETGLGTSHLVELLGQRVSRTVCNSAA